MQGFNVTIRTEHTTWQYHAIAPTAISAYEAAAIAAGDSLYSITVIPA
jgi:hypothetical protein